MTNSLSSHTFSNKPVENPVTECIPAPSAPTAPTSSGQTGAPSNAPVVASSSPRKPRMVYLSSSTTENEETLILEIQRSKLKPFRCSIYYTLVSSGQFYSCLSLRRIPKSCRQHCGRQDLGIPAAGAPDSHPQIREFVRLKFRPAEKIFGQICNSFGCNELSPKKNLGTLSAFPGRK
jgi:hypothetical protein